MVHLIDLVPVLLVPPTSHVTSGSHLNYTIGLIIPTLRDMIIKWGSHRISS